MLIGSLGSSRLASAVDFEQLEFEVEPLFSGDSDGRWNPVRVSIKSSAPQPRRVEVRIIASGVRGAQGTLVWDVQLSPGAVKRGILPCLRPLDRAHYAVAQVWEGGRRISPPDLSVRWSTGWSANGASAPRILAVGSTVGVEARAELPPADFDVRGLPEPSSLPIFVEAYEGVDHLILESVDPSDLSSLQRSTLRRAVQLGMHAWISPGSAGEGNAWILDEGELPIPARQVETSVEGKVAFEREPALERGVRRNVQTGTRGYPSRFYTYVDGLGSWNRLIHHGDPVPREELSRERSRSSILDGPTELRGWGSQGWGAERIPGWLRPLDGVFRREVDVRLVAGMLLCYLVIVCPVLFFLLKRRNRLIWLLWVQPVVVSCFVLAIYGLGYWNYGIPSAGYQTVILRTREGTTWADAAAVRSQYNSSARAWDLDTLDGSLPILLPINDERESCTWRVGPDRGGRLVGFRLPTWSLTHFGVEGAVDLQGRLKVHIPLVSALGGEEPTRVEFENTLPFAVWNPTVSLVRGGEVDATRRRTLMRQTGSQWLRFSGRIEPGEVRTLSAASAVGVLDAENKSWDAFKCAALEELSGVCVVDVDPEELPGGIRFGTSGVVETRAVIVTSSEGARR